MNFNSLFRVCLIFHTYDSANFKKHREYHHEKNATRWLRRSAYYRMCSTDVYCSKQTGSSSTKGNHHPSFLRFWNWAEETVDAAKICGGAENAVKTETQQTFVNGLLGFITLGIYTPLKPRVYCSRTDELPIDMGTYLHCSLIYFCPFQLFLHSDQPLWG